MQIFCLKVKFPGSWNVKNPFQRVKANANANANAYAFSDMSGATNFGAIGLIALPNVVSQGGGTK